MSKQSQETGRETPSTIDRLTVALTDLAALLEANYTYDTIDVKRWIADADACEICQDNEDLGWIPDGDTFDSVFGPIDDGEAHPNCGCEVEYGERRVRVYD